MYKIKNFLHKNQKFLLIIGVLNLSIIMLSVMIFFGFFRKTKTQQQDFIHLVNDFNKSKAIDQKKFNDKHNKIALSIISSQYFTLNFLLTENDGNVIENVEKKHKYKNLLSTDGKLSQISLIDMSKDQEIVIGKIKMTYDDSNLQQLTEIKEFNKNSKVVLTYKPIYDQNCNKLQEICELKDKNEIAKYQINYDKEGKLLEIKKNAASNLSDSSNRIFKFIYQNGQQLTEIKESNSNRILAIYTLIYKDLDKLDKINVEDFYNKKETKKYNLKVL